MYAWIWRKLPFGTPGKLTGSLALVALVGALLWYVIFPWATPLLPFDDVQVGTGTQQESGPGQQAPDVISSEHVDGPDEIPYSTHSNEPAPTTSAPADLPGE